MLTYIIHKLNIVTILYSLLSDFKIYTFKLFYTNLMAAVLKTPKELRDYMASDKQVYCIFKMDDWEDVEILHGAMHIVALEGNKLIASNKKPD